MYTTKYLQTSRKQLENVAKILSRSFSTLKEIPTQNLINNFKKSPEIRLNDKPVTKSAGVLIGLCENNGNVGLLFTLRSCLMKSHTRQVSFPGKNYMNIKIF